MSNFVYRGPFFFWLSILLGLAAFFAIKASMVSTEEGDALRTLVESSPRQIRKDQKKETRELTQQTRRGVTKQIHVADGPLRRLVDISAVHSKVRVVSKRPHMRVVETFYDVTGIVQCELYYITADGKDVIYNEDGKLAYRDKPLSEIKIDPATLLAKQRFRYFTASEAMYDFHTNQLLASTIKFWTYLADGHDSVPQPYTMPPETVGEAARMTFYVSGSHNKNNFSAESLKVQFTPQGGI